MLYKVFFVTKKCIQWDEHENRQMRVKYGIIKKVF